MLRNFYYKFYYNYYSIIILFVNLYEAFDNKFSARTCLFDFQSQI